MLHPGIAKAYDAGLKTAYGVSGVVALASSNVEADESKTQGEPTVFATDAENFLRQGKLHEEIFGPATLVVDAPSFTDLIHIAHRLEGQLTATLHATPEDLVNAGDLIAILERKAGRLIINAFPTGVEVSPAMHHGGPYPATTDERFTSVGTAAIQRFVRPVCFQSFPANLLPEELSDANPRQLMRLVNGQLTRDPITVG
jgi:NADP-dependent aldehyde dehydrogenase